MRLFLSSAICFVLMLVTAVHSFSLVEYLLYHAGRQSRHFTTTSDIRWGRGSKSLPAVMVQMEEAIPNIENHNSTMTE